MSDNEAKLRNLIDAVRGAYPGIAHEMLQELNALVAAQKTAGLEDAMVVFSNRQADLDRRLATAKSLPLEQRQDMKREGSMCSWAIHTLRAEAGRRKKPPRVRAKKEAK